MRRFTSAAALAAMAAVSLAGTGAHAASESYSVGQGDYVSTCRGEELAAGVPSPENIGGVCFKWGSGKTRVELAFSDTVSGSNVGFYYQWYNAAGDFLLGDTTDPVTGEPEPITGMACSPESIGIPSGGRGIKIWLDQAFGPLDCTDAPPGIATVGTVTATVS